VNTAPHFGHFTFDSFCGPAQPKANAKNATARIKLTSFFTPLHLLSLSNIFSLVPEGFPVLEIAYGEKNLEGSTPFDCVVPKLTKLVFLVKEKIQYFSPRSTPNAFPGKRVIADSFLL
jgi:hypothetical protein